MSETHECKKTEQPDECLMCIKDLRRYLSDTEWFLGKCEKCPVAEKLHKKCKELKEKLDKNHPISF